MSKEFVKFDFCESKKVKFLGLQNFNFTAQSG